MLSQKCFVSFFDEMIKRDGVLILIVNVTSSLFVRNISDMIRNVTAIRDKSVISCIVVNYTEENKKKKKIVELVS